MSDNNSIISIRDDFRNMIGDSGAGATAHAPATRRLGTTNGSWAEPRRTRQTWS
jgi:hypothetical protein